MAVPSKQPGCMSYCQGPRRRAVLRPSAHGKLRSQPGYVPETQDVSRPPKGTKSKCLRSYHALRGAENCMRRLLEQTATLIDSKKKGTHVIWAMTSSSVNLLVGFSDAFARRRTLIMSFPPLLSVLSLTMSREKLSEKSKNVRNRRYSREGRYRT